MSRRSWAFDIGLATVVVVLGQLEVWNGAGATHRQGPAWAQALVYAVVGILLVGRRVAPLRTAALIAGVFAVEFASVGAPEGNGVMAPLALAAYASGRWDERRSAYFGLGATAAGGLAWLAFDPASSTPLMKLEQLLWLTPVLMSWLVGALVRSQLQNAEQRRLRLTESATRAVAEERNRIARELHDVIGHSVSVMTVQASAVRLRLGPEQSTEIEALRTVESVGREALAEMRRMVAVLRQADAVDGREPPPTLGDLDRLVEKFRTAGLPVVVTITGAEQPLAPGLDLTAYRLVQEGLTNTLRHAVAPRTARVDLTWGPDRLDLAVIDDGHSVLGEPAAGHGLLGMRERVSVYGGEIVARPVTGGGFELRATLPLDPSLPQHDAAAMS